jgi:DNA invertase Pin-like site-specific DNA recombinase
LAIVYVRQSTIRQVHENVESTELQYRLQERAVALGWAPTRVMVIDEDLGVSGQSIEGRLGFQRLLAEVSLDHVGIVLGIEMSRLARSCRDWHQLLDLCGVFGTLIGDADGIYDPHDYNDRLLLGLKGTMSEAELHILRNRLDAGKRNKARRGAYFNHAPIGYQRVREGFIMEPDAQAHAVVQLIFDKFMEVGSLAGVLRYLRDHGIRIGYRPHRGPNRDQLEWRKPNAPTLSNILHHPIYAGAYVYGRRKSDPRRQVKGRPGTGRMWASPEEWQFLIKDALPAYITWSQWEQNQAKLKENSTHYGSGAPRGTNLLAGRVVCGRCGHHMSISYAGQSKARFTCDAARSHWGDPQCQALAARPLEHLVIKQLLRALEPASLELSLQAAESIEGERRRRAQLHEQSVERAKYQADVARRRFMAVEPENRLVAAELERQWENALHEQRHTEEELTRLTRAHPTPLSREDRQRILSLASGIPQLWHADSTSSLDRQQILRTLIDDVEVTVIDHTERVAVTIHWAGGYQSQHEMRRRVSSTQKLEAGEELMARLLQLRAEGWTREEIADRLNSEGYHTACGQTFNAPIVTNLFKNAVRKNQTPRKRELPPHHWRPTRLAMRIGTKSETLNTWRRRGWIQGRRVGRRWIYWADEAELDRLTRLRAHPRLVMTKVPTELTSPVSIPPWT